ncbi:hypothetical protein D9M68_982870 [compost metagenome]
MNYREQEHLKDAVEICDQIIYTQKFELAAAELLNPLFISKHLGMADVTKVDHTSSDGSMTPKRIELVALTADDNGTDQTPP